MKIGFFDITVPGLILFVVGTAYVLLVVPRFIRVNQGQAAGHPSASGHHFIGEIHLTDGHPFLGIASRSGLFPGLQEINPRLVIRRGIAMPPPFEGVTLSQGDRLVVSATRRSLARALSRGSAQPFLAESTASNDTGPASPSGGSRGADYHLAEVVVTPGSRHAAAPSCTPASTRCMVSMSSACSARAGWAARRSPTSASSPATPCSSAARRII